MFTTDVIEKLGYYVYFLKDPRNNEVFYVGKGQGNRIFEHVSGIISNPVSTDKMKIITEILSVGAEVQHFILRHGLTNNEAYEVEASLIDFIGLNNLTNANSGHNSYERGLMTVSEINELYNAVEVIVNDPVITININKEYKKGMTSEDLYNATHSCWRVDRKRVKKAKYAFAVYKGVIKEIYLLHDWIFVEIDEKGYKRWAFNGQTAEESIRNKYIYGSLLRYKGKRGAQNPIKYINC